MSFLGLFLFKDVLSLGASFYLVGYFGTKAILLESRGSLRMTKPYIPTPRGCDKPAPNRSQC